MAVVERLGYLYRNIGWPERFIAVLVALAIAVVPIVLILALVVTGAYILTGQVTVYLVTSAIERRTESLMGPAQELQPKPDPIGRPSHERQLARFQHDLAGSQLRFLAWRPAVVPPAQAINGRATRGGRRRRQHQLTQAGTYFRDGRFTGGIWLIPSFPDRDLGTAALGL